VIAELLLHAVLDAAAAAGFSEVTGNVHAAVRLRGVSVTL
jgi:hypothetical protein